jgi:UDP-glucose 4-epimerase
LKRILVIGGAGFIGSHLVDRLIADGRQVRVLDRVPVDLQPGWMDSPQVEYLAGDFNDHSAIDVAVRGIDLAYHLVSTTIPATSNVDPIFDVQSNLIGTLSFLKAAVQAGVRKVVFVSSGGTIYGKPVSVPIAETHATDPICSYGITKLAIEKYLAIFELLHGLGYTVFRLANPFGERQRSGAQGAIAAFMQKVARGAPIEIWGDGSVVRDYVYIEDVVDVLVKGGDYAGSSRIFNVGSGAGRSLNEIVEALRLVSGRAVECAYTQSRPLDVPRSVLDISLVRRELGWHPATGFSDALARTWKWFEAHSGGN